MRQRCVANDDGERDRAAQVGIEAAHARVEKQPNLPDLRVVPDLPGPALAGQAAAKRPQAEEAAGDWRLEPDEQWQQHQFGTVEQLEYWDSRRRRHWTHGSRPKPGEADGTTEALLQAQRDTIICGNCGGLVHLQSARRMARKRKHENIADGDGCAARSCVRAHYHRGRYAIGQRRMATALIAGKRRLLAVPDRPAARVALWQAPRHVEEREAQRVLAQHSQFEGA